MTLLEELPSEFLKDVQDSLGDRGTLVSLRGQGRSGIAFKISTPNNSETYCLKTINPAALSEGRLEAVREDLTKEVEILAPLSHRCLPRIIFHDLAGKVPFYVCTFHPGETFYELRQQRVLLPIEHSLFIIHSVIDTFDYLHKTGRSHCDAHQDNVLIGRNVFQDGIMIIDFGSGHRGSDPDPTTYDRGALIGKEPELQHRHQRPVSRIAASRDFERHDYRSVGVLLNVMREIFFADASPHQTDEYNDFCGDLQNGLIKSWDAARARLKFVIDPNHLQSRLTRYYQTVDKTPHITYIPTSSSIKVGDAFRALTETPAFQRLRGVKQLSFCDWEFPAAVHSRLEHSLGVFQIATEGVGYLCESKQFRRQFDEVHLCSLLISSLVHDIGHYPFAHVIEHYVASRFSDSEQLRRRVHHTTASTSLIGNDPQVSKVLVDYFSTDHVMEVKNILTKKRGFLSKLLDSTVDFDKIDYLKRDSYHCGIPYGSGYDSAELLRGIQFMPPSDHIIFAEDNAHAVAGFLILQSQMLSGVYWNENIRALFAMFHRFIDVCFGNEMRMKKDFREFTHFVADLQRAPSDTDAFKTVFAQHYEKFLNKTETKESKTLQKMLAGAKKFEDPLWRLVSVNIEPNPKLAFRCVNRFRFGDPLPDKSGAGTNVFNSIVRAPPGSTISGGEIAWAAVQKLRNCYLDSLEEKRIEASPVDVLVDIPWGKGASDPIKFISRSGKELSIEKVAHISSTIFSDLTIFAAPVRVFLAPTIFDSAQNELESLNAAALEKYFDPKREDKPGRE
jgi:HD superfamily phosphohydrolase